MSIYSREDNILSNILSENFAGYNPNKSFNKEIELTHDFEPLEATEEESHKFKLQHGDKLDLLAIEGPMAHEAQEGTSYLHPEVIQVL